MSVDTNLTPTQANNGEHRRLSLEKMSYLQVFPNISEQPRYPRAAFARQRSKIRVSSGPLLKPWLLQIKHTAKLEALDTHRGFVQQLCSNPNELLVDKGVA
jgi:hypothetical protein